MDIKLTFAVLCAVTCAQPIAAGTPERPEAKSARHFVQGFYDWYVAKALNQHTGPLWDATLKPRRSWFSPALLKALHEDAAASAKSPGEIVGLDFDPFLNSQDPVSHYFAGKVEKRGNDWIVAVSGGKPYAKTDVLARVEKHNGSWRFSNFLYPGGENLLGILKALKKDRH